MNLLNKFEIASGYIFTEYNLKCRKAIDVDMRDYYVAITSDLTDDYRNIMESIGKDRTSYFAALKRFSDRFETSKDYRIKFNEIKDKFTGQLSLF